MNVSATYKCAQRTGEAPLADAWRNASKEGASLTSQGRSVVAEHVSASM
jgi:hypothetical protein